MSVLIYSILRVIVSSNDRHLVRMDLLQGCIFLSFVIIPITGYAALLCYLVSCDDFAGFVISIFPAPRILMTIVVMIFVMSDSVEKRCSQIIRIAIAVFHAPMSVGCFYRFNFAL